jgi:DNA (cytosine-5)-methyltransferase 1
MPTVTGAHRGEQALVTPYMVPMQHENRPTGLDEPIQTVTTQGNKLNLVAPVLVNTRNGERDGQLPRVRDILEPHPTVTGIGSQGGLVSAFLARHYGGHENDGAAAGCPIPTVTAKDHHALVASSLVKLKGTSRDGQPVTEPLHTIQAGGLHYAEVRAFLIAYYGTQQHPQLDMPLPTATTKDRFGLVTVEGQDYAIADIGMRMLVPRELFRAQGFPDSYVIDLIVNGKPLSKTAQVRMCGNSVCPPLAAALARAQFAGAEEAVA